MNEVILSREQVLQDLLSYCNRFIERSSEWRKNSYEENWRKWQRNADSIYDPDLDRKKEEWQAKVVVPITASHLQNALAQLFKTEVGPRPAIEVKARKGIVTTQDPNLVNQPAEMGPMPGPSLPPDQSENIRDLILREREKSRYELNRNMVLQDKGTYGSGFARIRFETKTEDRRVKVPAYEQFNAFDPMSVWRFATGQRQVVGYEDKIEPHVIYRGVRFEWLPIWDVFPDPLALRIPGSTIAYRYRLTYGDVVKGALEGYYIPEAVLALKDHKSEEQSPEDKKKVEADREIADGNLDRTPYQASLICYELYGRLPKKWVLINGEEIDDPEALIPARICFHKDSILAVELNESYDGEPPIYKDDYEPVAGQFYGRGIPEMLKDVHLVAGESVCQRLDYASITLNPTFAVIEKGVVNPADLDGSRAGGTIRLKAPSGMALTSVDQLFKQVEMGNIDRAAFIEPQEWERYAQERSSITRATLGTQGQVRDANQTLGGQELQKEVSGDKLAYIGLLSEFDFQYEVTRAYWKLIYQNYQPEDYAQALGPERAMTVLPMTPEEVENSYQYYPMGIFTMENKAQRQARLQAIDAQFGMEPWFDRLAIAKAELMTADEDPDKFILPKAAAIQITTKAANMAQGMVEQQMAMEGQKPTKKPREAKA